MQNTERQYQNDFLSSRLDALSDGIFAIVMTLLVIEIRVPHLSGVVTSRELWYSVLEISDLFLSYILSFLVLFTYWVTQHYVNSIYAKNLTRGLLYLNIPYLMSIALIPFSSHLLGSYPGVPFAIWTYGANVILIGILGLIIFNYARHSEKIQNHPVSNEDMHYGYIRAILPIAAALIAMIIAFWSTRISILVFILSITLLTIPGLISKFDQHVISRVWRHDHLHK